MDMTQYILIVGGLIVLSFVYQGVAMYMHSMSKKKYENENNREFWNITMFLHDVTFM